MSQRLEGVVSCAIKHPAEQHLYPELESNGWSSKTQTIYAICTLEWAQQNVAYFYYSLFL